MELRDASFRFDLKGWDNSYRICSPRLLMESWQAILNFSDGFVPCWLNPIEGFASSSISPL